MTGSIWHVAIATLLFVGSHFALSSPPVRRPLVDVVGERPFLGLYSLLSLVLIIWTSIAYGNAPLVEVWTPPTGLRTQQRSPTLRRCRPDDRRGTR